MDRLLKRTRTQVQRRPQFRLALVFIALLLHHSGHTDAQDAPAAETVHTSESQAALIQSLLRRVEELERSQRRVLDAPAGTDTSKSEAFDPEMPQTVTAHPQDRSEQHSEVREPRSEPVTSIQPLFLNSVFLDGDQPLISEAGQVIGSDATSDESGASRTVDDPTVSLLSAHESRMAALERQFQDLQKKQATKTYPTVTVNGVLQADAGWFHQDATNVKEFLHIQDGADFRRARLSAKGSVTPDTNYFFQMDFGFFGRPTFTDVWVEQTNVPLLGNVRIGQWKQPFSLEVVSSFRYTTFMERSQLFLAFTPFRHIGTGFYDFSDELNCTWAASVFRSGQDEFGGSISTDGGWGTSERVTVLPVWENDGTDYLHLGVGHFFNNPPRDLAEFRTIPEFYIGNNAPGEVGTSRKPIPGRADGTPFFITSGLLTHVTAYNVVGTELLWVRGPFSLQSEAMVNMVNQAAGRGSSALPGAYAQVGYFLTGEHRPYDRKAGAIDRVIPRRNFVAAKSCSGGGLGAWEVAARWSWLDLNEGSINGGTMTDYTVGTNWYWNPYTKLVFNYIHSMPDTPLFGDSTANMFGVRAQVDF